MLQRVAAFHAPVLEAAGVEILKANVGTAAAATAATVFAVTSIVTIAAPVVVVVAAPERSKEVLASWRARNRLQPRY